MTDDLEDWRNPRFWISARGAVELLKPHLGEFSAQQTIVRRANDQVIRCRAENFFADDKEIIRGLESWFWWARGGAGLTQNWESGDFETSKDGVFYRAYGVQFARADIVRMVPASSEVAPQPNVQTAKPR